MAAGPWVLTFLIVGSIFILDSILISRPTSHIIAMAAVVFVTRILGPVIDLHGAVDLYFLRQIEDVVLILVFVVLGFLIHSEARFLLQLTMWDVMLVPEH